MNKVNFLNFITTASKIMKNNYPSISFIIEDFLPASGLTIFAGGSKTGKSLLTTQLLNSVSGTQDSFLGHKITKHGKVLYLALEDSEQRIKERFLTQNMKSENDNFNIATKWSYDEKAISDLNIYLELNPDTVLIVIDTKAKLCREQGIQVSYQGEYNFMGAIKKCADEHNINIMLITHLRKRPSFEDVFNEINGTSAIMGAADTILILKRPRNQNRGLLSLTSRDFQEREEEIYLDYESLTWHSQGDTQYTIPNMTPERMAIIKCMKEINRPCKPTDIAKILKKDNKTIGNLLLKMQSYYLVKKSSSKSGYWLLPEWEDESNLKDEEQDDVF